MLLEEFLKPLHIPQTAFADRLGVSYVRLNSIVNGHRGVTPDTALRLERATGTSAGFWLNLQRDWDLWQTLRSPAAEEIRKIQPLVELANT
jgi:addiction module HigA family antidote